MKKGRVKLNTKMSTLIIGAIVLLLIIFGLIVSSIGYFGFTEAFKNEYTEATYRMADTATTLINGDHIEGYLNGEYNDEYGATKNYLDIYCDRIHVTMLYVISVDKSDYGRFVCVFDSVNNDVGNTDYSPWELGYERNTTNDEYREKYKAVYEGKSDYETVFRTKTTDGQMPHITTIVPVKNSSGEVVAILCMHRMMSELAQVRQLYMLKIGLTALTLAVLVGVSYAFFIRRTIVTPIRKVSEEAGRFARENTKSENLEEITSFKELKVLSSSIEKMESDMLSYIENLTAFTAEKEKIGAELSVASVIQENSIPNVFPAFPERKEFDIFASMTPAKEVGGDFYNFFLIDEDHLAFVIGDVSGKGVPAALFMMVTNILISERTRMGGTPAEILSHVNDALCKHNKADMFVTLYLGILELSTGKVTAANAGHDDAAIYRKGGEFELFKTKHGLAAGAMEGVRYRNFEIQLEKGDKLFIYTDGVPEATNKDEKLFTINRMTDTLNEYKDLSPKGVIEGVTNNVNAFVGDAPQFDDITMLCIELSEAKKERTLVVDATVENLSQVTRFVDSFLEENECSQKTQMKIELAVEEAFTNVASYAYGQDVGQAEISASIENKVVTIVFKDSGKPYDPLAKEDPDVTLSAEDRKIGGLGIFLVKKNMDEVSYAYENGKNVLTIKKSI